MLHAKAPFITRHDYQVMPGGPPYFQVIEGELVMSPSPNLFHQETAGRIHSLLLNFLEQRPLGEVFIAPLDVFLSDINVYLPDVIFVSNARRSILTERGIEGPPDLVVEILSPGLARLEFFGSNGVTAVKSAITPPDSAARWVCGGPLQTPCWSLSIRARPGDVCIRSNRSTAPPASPSLHRIRRR